MIKILKDIKVKQLKKALKMNKDNAIMVNNRTLMKHNSQKLKQNKIAKSFKMAQARSKQKNNRKGIKLY